MEKFNVADSVLTGIVVDVIVTLVLLQFGMNRLASAALGMASYWFVQSLLRGW